MFRYPLTCTLPSDIRLSVSLIPWTRTSRRTGPSASAPSTARSRSARSAGAGRGTMRLRSDAMNAWLRCAMSCIIPLRCNALRCVALHFNAFQRTALQVRCVATPCNALQRDVCGVLALQQGGLQRVATRSAELRQCAPCMGHGSGTVTTRGHARLGGTGCTRAQMRGSGRAGGGALGHAVGTR